MPGQHKKGLRQRNVWVDKKTASYIAQVQREEGLQSASDAMRLLLRIAREAREGDTVERAREKKEGDGEEAKKRRTRSKD